MYDDVTSTGSAAQSGGGSVNGTRALELFRHWGPTHGTGPLTKPRRPHKVHDTGATYNGTRALELLRHWGHWGTGAV